MKSIYSRGIGKSILSALGVKHLPPGNFFKNSLFKMRLYPRYVRLELTHKCNLKCAVCPSFLHNPEAGKRELSLEDLKTILDELGGYKQRPYVSVSGGEPFLRQDIFDILGYLELRGLKYKILTNAAAMPPGSKDKLKSLNPDIFQVSLDGPEQIHDKIRGTPGAFLRTIETIRYLKENTKFKILLMCVINSINSEYLFDTVAIAQDLGVDLCFGHLSFIGLKRFAHQKRIMKEEFGIELDDSRIKDINDLHNLDVRLLSDQIARIQGQKTRISVHFTQQLSREQIARHYSDNECYVFSDKCYYPWYGVRIDPYGGVSVCKDDYIMVGNVLENPLLRLYNNYQSNKFRDYIRKNLLPLCLRCCWCGSGDSMTTVFKRDGSLS